MKSNTHLQQMIQELKKRSIEQNVNLWKRVAVDLEKPNKNKRIVNINKLAKYTTANETVVVPGKVLGTGEINHKLNVAALEFSKSAIEKISKNGQCMSLYDLSKTSPKGKKIRIIG